MTYKKNHISVGSYKILDFKQTKKMKKQQLVIVTNSRILVFI